MEKYEIGDLVRCWHMVGMGFTFSVGLLIKLEEKYAKVCLQESGQVVTIAYRSMFLLERNNK